MLAQRQLDEPSLPEPDLSRYDALDAKRNEPEPEEQP
jgi:hypothetical protein